MKKYFERTKNLICILIALIISAFCAIVLQMTVMFPALLMAIVVLGASPTNGKRDWEAVFFTGFGGLIIQLFILL